MKKSFWSLGILFTLVSLYGCGNAVRGIEGEEGASMEVLSQVVSEVATPQRPELAPTNLTQVQVDSTTELNPVQANLTEIDPPLVYQETQKEIRLSANEPETDKPFQVSRVEKIVIEIQE